MRAGPAGRSETYCGSWCSVVSVLFTEVMRSAIPPSPARTWSAGGSRGQAGQG